MKDIDEASSCGYSLVREMSSLKMTSSLRDVSTICPITSMQKHRETEMDGYEKKFFSSPSNSIDCKSFERRMESVVMENKRPGNDAVRYVVDEKEDENTIKHDSQINGKCSPPTLYNWDPKMKSSYAFSSLKKHDLKMREGYLNFLSSTHGKQQEELTSARHSESGNAPYECVSKSKPTHRSTRRHKTQKGRKSYTISPSYDDTMDIQEKCNWRSSELEMGSAELGNFELEISELPQNGCKGSWNLNKIQSKAKRQLDIANQNGSYGTSDTHIRELDKVFPQDQWSSSQESTPITTSDFSETSYNTELESLPLLEQSLHSSPSETYRNTGHNRETPELSRDLHDANNLSLSQKYMPKCFEDIVGQNLIIQSLSNALSKEKIAPVYIFYGPRGTGKTSCAKVFAMALNCTSDGSKPCGSCVECLKQKFGKSSTTKEIHAEVLKGKKGCVKLLKHISTKNFWKYRVFIIDECHTLSSEAWDYFMKAIEDVPRNIVFILSTSSLDQIPDAVISRCQKFIFSKIKESEIINRLKLIAIQEGLEVDVDALSLIASTCDGSLRDAETILDQLSLLGHKITLPMAQELMGLVPDENLVDLLDFALSADTVNTVRNMKNLTVSGVEPLNLVSQLACLITRILAGGYHIPIGKEKRKFFQRKPLTKEDMGRLQQALKTLLEAEKQLRNSSDRTTWLTAALLQFAPEQSYIFPNYSFETSFPQSSSGANTGDWTPEMNLSHISQGASDHESAVALSDGSWQVSAEQNHQETIATCQSQTRSDNRRGTFLVPGIDKNVWLTFPCDVSKEMRWQMTLTKDFELQEVWQRVLDAVHSSSLRKFLQMQGKLLSLSLSKGFAAAVLEFSEVESNLRAERSRTSIAHAFQVTLGYPVDVKIRLASSTRDRSTATSGDELNTLWQHKSSLVNLKDSRTLENAGSSDHRVCNSFREHADLLEPQPTQANANLSCEVHSRSNDHFPFQTIQDNANSRSLHHRMDVSQEINRRSTEFIKPQETTQIIKDNQLGIATPRSKSCNFQKITVNDDDIIASEDRLESAWVEAVPNNEYPAEQMQSEGSMHSSVEKHVLSLGFVIQQEEGLEARHDYDTREVAAKLEEDNLRLDSKSRRLLCWKATHSDEVKVKGFQDIPSKKQGFLFSLCACATISNS